MRDYIVYALLPATGRTASANGTAVDLQETVNAGGREVKAVLDVGNITGATGTLDVKLQESDQSGSGFVDIAGAAFSQVTTTTGSQEIHARVSKRYVRAVATLGGTSPNFTFGAYLVARRRLA